MLRLGPPAGEFVLPEPVPEKLLFVTAGSGVTPVMGMLRHLAATRPETLAGAVAVHCDRTADDVVFGAELRALAGATGMRLVERHTALDGRLTPDALTCLVPDWAARQAWACGPAGLLDDLSDWWDRHGDPDALHVERFVARAPAAGAGTGGRVRFTASKIETDAGPGRAADGAPARPPARCCPTAAGWASATPASGACCPAPCQPAHRRAPRHPRGTGADVRIGRGRRRRDRTVGGSS